VVVIHIPIMVALLDHDGVVMVVTLANDVPITITITVAGSDGHADWTDADADFFRAGRHRKGNSGHRYRGYYKMSHRMLLNV
jgi:hypothetical protein